MFLFMMWTSFNRGGGILHIFHPVKVTLLEGRQDHPHFTSRQSHINWGMGSSTFHIQSKSHCLGGWYPSHFTSYKSHIIWVGGWVVVMCYESTQNMAYFIYIYSIILMCLLHYWPTSCV